MENISSSASYTRQTISSLKEEINCLLNKIKKKSEEINRNENCKKDNIKKIGKIKKKYNDLYEEIKILEAKNTNISLTKINIIEEDNNLYNRQSIDIGTQYKNENKEDHLYHIESIDNEESLELKEKEIEGVKEKMKEKVLILKYKEDRLNKEKNRLELLEKKISAKLEMDNVLQMKILDLELNTKCMKDRFEIERQKWMRRKLN